MPKPTSSDSPVRGAGADSLSAALRAAEATYSGDPEDGPDTSAEGGAEGTQPTPRRTRLTGNPREGATDLIELGPDADLEEEEQTPPATEPKPVEGEEAEGEGAPGAVETPPQDGVKPPKYKTVEEAERGQREAERRMHDATTAQAHLQAKLDKMGAEYEGLKLEFSQAKTKKSKEEIGSRMRTFLDTISGFDRDAEDFTAKSAEAYRDLFSDVVPSLVEDLIEQRLEAKFGALSKKNEDRERLLELRKDAVEEATKQGLDMGKKSPERELFFALAEHCEGDTFEDQVDWTIKRVKALKGRFLGAAPEGQQGGPPRPRQPLQSPGSGVLTRESSKQPERPITLNEALTASERRV